MNKGLMMSMMSRGNSGERESRRDSGYDRGRMEHDRRDYDRDRRDYDRNMQDSRRDRSGYDRERRDYDGGRRGDYGRRYERDYSREYDGRPEYMDDRGRDHYSNGRYAPERKSYREYDGDEDEYFFKVKGKFGRKEEMEGMRRGMPDFKKMDEETAKKWVSGMENADGTHGPHWKPEEVKQLLQQKDVNADFWPLYAALNAEYSDRSEVNKKHGVNRIEFYLDSVMAFWFHDEDAVRNKVTAYYECVVDHEK